MKTVEEKATEYAERMYPNTDSNDYSRTTAEEWDACYDGYVNGYNDAMRWRAPKEAPQNTDMLVKYTMADDIFNYTCLEKDRDDTWHWWGEEWDVDKYPIIGWRPIEEGG